MSAMDEHHLDVEIRRMNAKLGRMRDLQELNRRLADSLLPDDDQIDLRLPQDLVERLVTDELDAEDWRHLIDCASEAVRRHREYLRGMS